MMNVKSRSIVCGMVWATLSATARAQDVASSEEGPVVLELEEVVVTAEKREENLQKTAIAITAVDSDQLAQSGVRQIQQLQNVAPGVQVQDVASVPHISIRGIMGVGQGASQEQPLAMYVDGAYLPRPQSYAGTFFDVERLEVLLGPQGTLYGRNAVSGVVNVISKKPGDGFAANGELDVGSDAARRFEGGVSFPIADTLSGRLAVMTNDRDGYFKNGTADVGEKSVRGTLQFQPTDQQRLVLIGDYEKIDNNGQPGARKGQSGEAGNATIYSSSNANVLLPEEYDNNFAYGAHARTFYRGEQYGITAQYDYEFEPATLTVLGSYRSLDSETLYNDGFTLNRLGTLNDVSLSESISKFTLKTLEVRLTSSETVPLKWVAGLYALYQSNTGGVHSYSDSDIDATYASYQADVATVINDNPYDTSKGYAAFADATWTPDALPQLHLTTGIRYSRDDKEGTTVHGGYLGGTAETNTGEKQSSAVTWRFTPAYDLTDTSMVYASVARGYEAGGFAFAPAGQDPSYKPQYVTAFELGSKNEFMDNRLRFNADIFYYDYVDQQYIYGYTTAGPSGVAVNVGITNFDAQYWGSSATLQAVLTEADLLTFDVAYAYGESGGLAVSQIDSSLQDAAKGDRLRSVTPWSANVSYEHAFDFGTTQLTPQILFHYTRYATQKYTVQDSALTDYVLADGTVVYTDTPDVRRLDVLLSWADSDDRWEVTAYARNLTDRYDADGVLNYNPATNDGAAGTGNAEYRGMTPMAPRSYGVMLKARF